MIVRLPKHTAAKAITAAVGATIITLPLLADGVTLTEAVAILVAWASAFGVYKIPNTPA